MSGPSIQETQLSSIQLTGRGIAIAKVLTLKTLFRHITSFMSGWPFLVIEFERAAIVKYPNWRFLVHIAVAEKNERVVKAIGELLWTPQYRNHPKLQSTDVSNCIICNKSEVLELLRDK